MTRPDIEDSYGLSPMQEGMLFTSLYGPHSGVYVQQMVGELREELDVSAFRLAWQRIVERHAVLRTSFCLEGEEKPLQTVHQFVQLPFEEQDWRELSDPEQEQGLQAYLEADRRRGFDLTQAPLVRVAVFRCKDADYRFVWTSHHALLDGRSRRLLLEELFAVYEVALCGADIQLKAARPFKDYIDWLGSQDFNWSEGFWKQLLKGFTAPTPLVVDRAGGNLNRQEFGHDEQKISLSETVTSALRSVAKRYHITLNTLFQGAWALLLSRYSGEENVVFGAIRACRHSTIEAADSMVGVLINNLPVRASVASENFLVPWLKELRAQDIALRKFEQTPLVNVQSWSDRPAGVPLYESLLIFDNYLLGAELKRQDRSWQNRDMHLVEQTSYPLNVYGYAEPEFILKIAYDRQRFDPDSIARMLGHLKTLLEGMAADVEQRLEDIQLLTEAERHQILTEWNDTRIDYPKELSLHQLVEAQVKRTPDAVAVVHEGSHLTYRDLNARANQFAHYLQRLGVGPDVLVGVAVKRSLEMAVGLLGILKAGGAYVPIDPAYPQERIGFILEDAKAQVLVTEQQLSGGLSRQTARLILMDTEWEAIGKESAGNPAAEVTATNLAYVIYTSGSTGKPKGVAIEHRSAVALLSWAKRIYTDEDFAGLLASTSICFDLSVFELFCPLTSGGRVILVKDALELPALPPDAGVTLVNTVPSAIAELLHAKGGIPPSVRTVNLAGEPLSDALVHQLYQRETVQQVFDLYGPSEDTTYSTYALRKSGGPATIGRPIANTQIYILDSHLMPVPRGVPGELYIGGAGLARGYLNRPELTAGKFIPDFFSNEPGARLYQTGDLARYLADGNIEFLGRLDHQVKIRGFRIELGEIETALNTYPAVREAVVVAWEDNPGAKRLVAYVVLGQEQTLTISDLRGFLKQKLPDYMIPSAFVVLDTLPLTPNGKLDRRALPAPDQSKLEPDGLYVPPQNELEKSIVKIWQQVLHIEKVGTQDNFFDLGGHSLLLMQVNQKLRNVIGRSIPVVQMFQYPTVRTLAQSLSQDDLDVQPSLQQSASRGRARRGLMLRQ